MKRIIPLLLTALLLSGCNTEFAFTNKSSYKKDNSIADLDLHEEMAVEGVTSQTEVGVKSPSATPCEHSKVIHYDALSPTFNEPGHIEFYLCLDCQKSYYDYKCQNEISNTEYGVKDMRDGRYLSPLTRSIYMLPKNVRNYLDAENESDVIAALLNNRPLNDQISYQIHWNDNYNSPYTVEVSQTRDFTSFKSYVVAKASFTFERILIPGQTYYYRIKDASNNLLVNDLSFKPENKHTLRTLYVEGVNNVRDTGGWKTIDGKKVKYGMVYRGGRLPNITEQGKETFLDGLGIKTEIDLRYPSYGGVSELSDPHLNYVNCGMWFYNRIMPNHQIPPEAGYDEGSPVAIKNIMELLADESNYPVYYHCISGADRTGTVAYLVNGLLGVSYEDLTKDFELTTFSKEGKRYRSNLVNDEYFDDSGIQSTQDPFVAWGKMHEYMCADYELENDKRLSATIENYLKTICNVSDETIASIRNILLED